MNNLELWERVEKTDPLHTKAFKTGFSGTAINATYLVKIATEIWGMIGIGWGYVVKDERIDVGGDVYNDSGEVIGQTKTHTIQLELWVKVGEEKSVITHYGHTPYIYYSVRNKYWITDQEAPKKSLTDALKKCLSMHGFSADIYLGLYDDVNYVEEVRQQKMIEDADDKVEEKIRQKKEYTDLLDKNIKLINESVSMSMLEGIYKKTIIKVTRRGDKEGEKRLVLAKDKAKKRLEKDTK